MFKNAKIGDRLYSMEDGWGVLEDITDRDHPLTIQFDSRSESFTLEGRRCAGSKNPTIFWDKIEFKIPKKRQLPNLKVDTKVIVWDTEGEPKKRRYFKEFNKDGKITCFVKGATSWATSNTVEWKYWELVE